MKHMGNFVSSNVLNFDLADRIVVAKTTMKIRMLLYLTQLQK